MSTQLNDDVNIIANSDLEITYFEGDVNIIQKLDDEPNDVGGLTSAELKAKFDEGANIIKKFINESLIPELLAADATEATRAAAEAERVSNEEGRVRAEQARVEAETTRQTNEGTRGTQEAQRAAAEQERANAEAARKTAEEGRATAENLRVTSENARSTAEQNRAAAESGRATAETTRVQNENARAQAEQNRATAETQRVAAEKSRADAETARSVWEEYSNTKTYVPGNKVSYQGSSYQNKKACTGVLPPDDASCWFVIAAAGADGKGAGDMLASVYDPKGIRKDIFAYADEQDKLKQDLLKGKQGQIVGFDAEGKAVAMDNPSGGFVLASIAITQGATKTAYLKGETFNPAGIELKATYANGATLPVSLSGFTPSGPLEDGTTYVTIQYTEGGVTKTAQQSITVTPILTGLQVTTPPTKTVYTYGESFSAAGMVVTGVYSDGHTAAVTGYTTSPASFTSVGAKDVTITYSENGYTATAVQTVTVNKAAGSMSISPTTLSLGAKASSGTIAVTRVGNGAVSAVSDNPDLVSVSVSGTTVTATCHGSNPGTANITVSVAAGTNHTAPASQVCVVTVSYVSSTLNSNDWDVISSVADSDEGANYWAVGDTKTITINGTVGSTAISNLSMDAYIIGFNHNASVEGAHRIHFKLGKINGAQVGLVDANYNSQQTASGKFTMNTSNTNSGGWASSHMRKTVLGSDSSPTSPTANTLLAALPAALRAVMKPLTKYSDNTGGGSDTASYVTATTDYLPLLAEKEVFGTRTYANSAEQNKQAQYAYYSAGNAKIHYKHNATTTAAWAWLRSVYYDDNGSFLIIDTDGTVRDDRAYLSGAVAPGFAV